MDINTQLLLIWAVSIIVSLFVGKAIVNYWFEIRKRNRYMEAQIKLLALIAAANEINIEKVSEIVAATGIKVINE